MLRCQGTHRIASDMLMTKEAAGGQQRLINRQLLFSLCERTGLGLITSCAPHRCATAI
jgi:hypothetical protein